MVSHGESWRGSCAARDVTDLAIGSSDWLGGALRKNANIRLSWFAIVIQWRHKTITKGTQYITDTKAQKYRGPLLLAYIAIARVKTATIHHAVKITCAQLRLPEPVPALMLHAMMLAYHM
jgi:hypothetical protein